MPSSRSLVVLSSLIFFLMTRLQIFAVFFYCKREDAIGKTYHSMIQRFRTFRQEPPLLVLLFSSSSFISYLLFLSYYNPYLHFLDLVYPSRSSCLLKHLKTLPSQTKLLLFYKQNVNISVLLGDKTRKNNSFNRPCRGYWNQKIPRYKERLLPSEILLAATVQLQQYFNLVFRFPPNLGWYQRSNSLRAKTRKSLHSLRGLTWLCRSTTVQFDWNPNLVIMHWP